MQKGHFLRNINEELQMALQLFFLKISENLFSTFSYRSPDINNNFIFIFMSRKSKSIPKAQGNGEVEGI